MSLSIGSEAFTCLDLSHGSKDIAVFPSLNFTDPESYKSSDTAYFKISQLAPGHQEDPNVGMFWQLFSL